MEVVIASSSVDAGVGCWELQSGAEQLRHKSCASPPHGLICVGRRFLASSQLRNSSSSSAAVLYWSWSKPQTEVKSFPAEQIKPLAANTAGTYIVGGAVSGDIYLWEVASGRLLKKWHAHYRGVTCLVFSKNDSLLVSGSEDGSVKVWSLTMVLEDYLREEASNPYVHSFSDHTLCVTDVIIGYGSDNAVIVSASEDRTCKVWSLSSGKLLRNVVFPSIIDAVALDPGEQVFYAGGRDGKIHIAALSAESLPSKSDGRHVISSFSNQSKAVTCLEYAPSGDYLISGSDDGMVRVWDARTYGLIRVFRHGKGPVNNIVVVTQRLWNFQGNSNSKSSSKRSGSLLPPLEKYGNSTDEDWNFRGASHKASDAMYLRSSKTDNHIKEHQLQVSAGSDKMELETLKLDLKKSMELAQRWKRKYEDLHQFCINELLDDIPAQNENGRV